MYLIKQKFFLLIFLLIFILCFVHPLRASQRLINFQGHLTDQQGNPLDGTYNIKFTIYPSDPNTKPFWTEEHTDVSVNNGIVNVLLGSMSSFEEPVKVTFDEERYLGITIDCDHDPNTKEDEMTPRQLILPAIYSYNADKLDGKDSTEYTTPQTDAGRPGVVENLYEGHTRLVDKYLGREAKAADSDKLDGYHATTSGSDNNSVPVINSGVTYSNLRAGYASSAGSCSNADTVDGYHAGSLRERLECKVVEGPYVTGGKSTATCPSGYILTGGGHERNNATAGIYKSGPSGNSWEVHCGESWTMAKAHAICCRLSH